MRLLGRAGFPDPIRCKPYGCFIPRTKGFLQDIGYLGSVNELSVKTYADIYGVCYCDVGIETHRVSGGEYSRVDRMLVDIVLWALDNPATYFKPVDLMVLSQHVKEGSDFLHALEALQDRYYNVILIQHESSPSTLGHVFWPCFLSSLYQGRNHKLLTFPEPRHKQKFIEDTGPFPERVVSVRSKETPMTDVVIFMDGKGSPTDKPSDFALFINQALIDKGYYGSTSIQIYLDKDDPRIFWAKSTKRITFVINSEHKEAKFTRMLLDMLFWVMNNEEQTHFLLISKPPRYMSQDLLDNIVRVLDSRGSDLILPPSNNIELPLSRDAFDSLCKDPRVPVVLPFSPDEEIDPKLERFALAEHIRIFWVPEEFPSHPLIVNFIYWSMKATLERKGYFGSVTVQAYAKDMDHIRMMLPHRKCGMTFSHLPEGNKYEKFTRIIADMDWYARNHGKGSSLILVSEPFKDAMFDRFSESLRRYDFNVFQTDLDNMVTFGTAAWSCRTWLALYYECQMCIGALEDTTFD